MMHFTTTDRQTERWREVVVMIAVCEFLVFQNGQ